jgi:hypothetical protein
LIKPIPNILERLHRILRLRQRIRISKLRVLVIFFKIKLNVRFFKVFTCLGFLFLIFFRFLWLWLFCGILVRLIVFAWIFIFINFDTFLILFEGIFTDFSFLAFFLRWLLLFRWWNLLNLVDFLVEIWISTLYSDNGVVLFLGMRFTLIIWLRIFCTTKIVIKAIRYAQFGTFYFCYRQFRRVIILFFSLAMLLFCRNVLALPFGMEFWLFVTGSFVVMGAATTRSLHLAFWLTLRNLFPGDINIFRRLIRWICWYSLVFLFVCIQMFHIFITRGRCNNINGFVRSVGTAGRLRLSLRLFHWEWN